MDDVTKTIQEIGQAADEFRTRLPRVENRLVEIEQKLVRRFGGGGDGAPGSETWGDAVVNSTEFMSLKATGSGSARVKLEQRAITSVGTSGGPLIRPDRAGPVMLPERRLTIRALLSQGNTTSNLIEYPRESAFTNSAAPVAETMPKPYSDMAFALANAPVRTLAHLLKVSRQALDDAAQLRALIDTRLRYGLAFVEETQILSGDGLGQNLSGLIPNATAYETGRTTSGDTEIDILLNAIGQVEETTNFEVNGVVLSARDWTRIRRRKDSAANYLLGNANDAGVNMLWGRPVIPTAAVAQGRFLVGAFDRAAMIFDRMEAEVLVSSENVDDFERNMLTVRGEQRLALAVFLPSAMVTGTFPATIPVP